MMEGSLSAGDETKDPAFNLTTGEVIYVEHNTKVYQNNGRLKTKSLFSENHLLFTIDWPSSIIESMSVTSVWHLDISNAESEIIRNLMTASAEKMGMKNWKTVTDVAKLCWEQFGSCMLRISSEEVEFAHHNENEAFRMKESKTMVDVMTNLLVDTADHQFKDFFVDWKVTIVPKSTLRAGLVVSVPQDIENLQCSLMEDRDSDEHCLEITSEPDSLDFTRSLPTEGLQWLVKSFQRLLEAEASKTLEVWSSIADKQAKRMEEMHSMLRDMKEQLETFTKNTFSYSSSIARPDQCKKSNDDDKDETEEETDEMDEETDTFDEEMDGSEEETQSIALKDYFSDAGESERSGEDHGFPQLRPQPSHDLYDEHIHENKQKHKRSKEPKGITEEIRREMPHSSSSREGKQSLKDKENCQLNESVEAAYEDDPIPPPRAKKSFHTVLCLDISESMRKGDAYKKMVEIVHKFLDGVEDVVTETGVEENIGLVTFGGRARVVQNLTNDLSRIREAVDSIVIGRKSPFVEALLVSMAAFVRKASIISVSGEYSVKPRIIFISDGHPTENVDSDETDFPINPMHVRTSLTRLMMDFGVKKQYLKISPIFYIPVGDIADKDLMKSMATLSNGVYMEPTDKAIKRLCNYFTAQETIGKTLTMIRKNEPSALGPLIKSLASNLSEEEQEEVASMVKKEMENPNRRKRRSKPDDFVDVFEDTDQVNAGDLLPLGTRVVRGPDWKWDNQDEEGPGTVLNHSEANTTYVLWDNGHYNRYCYGPEVGFDVWKTEEHPRPIGKDGQLEIGMVVEKGPDWECNDHNLDLQHTKTAVVIRKCRREKKLMVRWDNGERQTVPWGKDEKCYVQFCSPSWHQSAPQDLDVTYLIQRQGLHQGREYLQQQEQQQHTAAAATFEHGRWEWMADNESWYQYSEENSEILEQAYKRKPTGSCIVKREGRNRRIMFRRMTEKLVDGGTECSVRRLEKR